MGDLTENFSLSEVQCKCGQCKGGGRISPDLMEKLQAMRNETGQPITITSGIRCRQHPESIKRPTSSHIPLKLGDSEGKVGHAVDIATGSARRRFFLLEAAFDAGFERIGIGRTFLHLDNDFQKAQDVVFDYYD
jgi:zinc D-Ala-D-Ala carboxypeptidase